MFHKLPMFNICIALLILISLFAAPTSAAAEVNEAPLLGKTITVTVFTDDITKNGNCTLREAVQAANTDKAVDKCPAGSGTDTIKLAAGTYEITIPGRFEYQNKTGDFDVTNSVKIVGAGFDKTIIDAKGNDRIFDLRSQSATYEIRDMTLTNGLLLTDGKDVRDDGGALANKGSVTLTRVHFINNKIDQNLGERGGAIFNGNKMKIVECHFEENESTVYGGAIANARELEVLDTDFVRNHAINGGAYYADNNDSTAVFRRAFFIGNTNGPGEGSAMAMKGGGYVEVREAIFRDQGSSDGEVIHNENSDLTIRYTLFHENDGGGAGIINSKQGKVSISNSTFRFNRTSSESGIITISGGTAVVDRMTFHDNVGEALWLAGGSTKVANSTFTGQTTSECAAAVCVTGGTASFESVTIARNNSDDDPSLVVRSGKATVHNSIIAYTLANGAPIVDCSVAKGTTTSSGYNIIGVARGCGWTPGKNDQLGTVEQPVDPMLDAALGDHGGYNTTLALLPGSPAVDKADPANTVKTDQRIFKRPAGPRSDIGAFELNSVASTSKASEIDPEAEVETAPMEPFEFHEDYTEPGEEQEFQQDLVED